MTRGRLPSGSSRKMNWLLTSRTFPSINRASPKRSQVILEKQVGQRSSALLILAMTAMIRSEGLEEYNHAATTPTTRRTHTHTEREIIIINCCCRIRLLGRPGQKSWPRRQRKAPTTRHGRAPTVAQPSYDELESLSSLSHYMLPAFAHIRGVRTLYSRRYLVSLSLSLSCLTFV